MKKTLKKYFVVVVFFAVLEAHSIFGTRQRSNKKKTLFDRI